MSGILGKRGVISLVDSLPVKNSRLIFNRSIIAPGRYNTRSFFSSNKFPVATYYGSFFSSNRPISSTWTFFYPNGSLSRVTSSPIISSSFTATNGSSNISVGTSELLRASFVPTRSFTDNHHLKDTYGTGQNVYYHSSSSRPSWLNIKLRYIRSRSMATHRDLGFGGNNGNKSSWGNGGGNWGPSSRMKNIFRNNRVPLLFTGAVLAVTTFIFPLLFQIPGMGYVKKHPEIVVYGLIAINLGGYLAWKSRKGGRFMYRYGLLHKDSQFNKWGMLGSAFSHQEIWHIGVNMYVLHSFGTAVIQWIGPEQFLSLYIDGAVLSSLGSLMLPVLIKRFTNIPSLGASGAVFAVFALYTYLAPHSKLGLFFVPIPLDGWTVFLATLAYNGAGLFFRFGGSDYAGHFAGSLVGIAWGWYLTQRARRARERRKSIRGW